MIHSIIQLCILLFALSCSQSVKEKTGGSAPHILGVDTRDQADEAKPQLLIDRTGTHIEPLTDGESMVSEKSNQSAVIAFGMGPGLMRSFVTIDILREMEKKNFKPHILHGVDMASVFLSLYAFGISLDMIEWLFFNFLHESRDDPAFSEKWLLKVEEIVLKEIGQKKVSESSITLLIPVYNSKKAKIEYPRDMTINELFRAQFRFSIPRKSHQKYTSPIPHGMFFTEEIRKKGADIIVGFDFIGESISFSKPNSFMHGVYGRSSSKAKEELNKLDMMIELNFLVKELDRINIQSFREQYSSQELSDKITPVIESYYQWRPNQEKESEIDESFDQIFDLRENSEPINEEFRDE